jgi:serine/threonine protein kinase
MSIVAGNRRELIPGYRLLERLGHGGFGEVWKAEAPGGLLKAVKIVYGTIDGIGEFDAPARQELKALERVKGVRHPFVLSLERFDIVEGQLVIVTELADKHLGDRFNECRAQGLPGIPRAELLRHMAEAAEALDLMNLEYQLQHLDIKPQNLFLVYNHVKVADFGLVKDLAGMRTQMTSGITAGYAPPETFEGLVSPFCDQYSLAIVYQELLTGQLAFSGSNPRQLMMQHVTAAPNLEPLPEEDRPVIGRALAKKPEDRFPSCGELLRALTSGAQAVAASAPVPSPRVETTNVVAAPPEDQTVFTGPVRQSSPDSTPVATRPQPAPEPRPASPIQAEQVRSPSLPEVLGDGLLFPALVVGLGSAGRDALRCLRKAMCKRWRADGLPNVRLLLLDADPDELAKATQGDADTSLRGQTLLARLQRPSYYLKPGRERTILERWLVPESLVQLPRDQTTPGSWRVLGRLAFAANSTAIASRLDTELNACSDEEMLEATAKQTSLGLRTNQPRVYIIGDLGDGTGSGMFVDVAYMARQRLRQMGYGHPQVVALLQLPAVESAGEKARLTANAFAALTELDYFSARTTVFAGYYLDQGSPAPDPGAPFSRCFVLPVPRGEERVSRQELANRTGEFLVRELATPLARVTDEARSQRDRGRAAATRGGVPSASPGGSRTPQAGLICQTFGAYWFAVPRRLLLQRVARCLCHRLVQSWRAENPQQRQTKVQTWIEQQLAQCHLTPEELATEVMTETARILAQSPEAAIQAVLANYGKDASKDIGGNPALAAEAIAAIEEFVGKPGSDVSTAPASLADFLAQAASGLASQLEERLAEMALRGLVEPHFRLLGLQDLVQGRLTATLTEVGRANRTAAEKLVHRAATQHSQIASVVEALRKGSFWGWGKKDRLAAELLELLQGYGMFRYRAMIHQALSVVYEDLHANLHRYLRRVDCCRGRITQFLQVFEDSAAAQAHVDLGLGQYLLPAGCRTLPEAVEQILSCLSPEELDDINRRVQALIGRAFQEQVHVCTAPADFFKELEEQVLREVTSLSEAPLGRAHAAEVYVAQRGQDDQAVGELAGAFDEAVPELATSRPAPQDELNILAVPPGVEGERFRGLVQQALPDQTFVPALSTDDIVFYREVLRLSPADLPQKGQAAAKVYQQFLTGDPLTPHSRTDITDWRPASPGA